MRRKLISTAVVAIVLISVPATSTAAMAAPTAPAYVDQRVSACVPQRGGGCRVGAVVRYWYKKGAESRGVGWVYASRGSVNAGSARWLYKWAVRESLDGSAIA